MARFPLFLDANIRGQLVGALREQGWDIECAHDVFPEGTEDDLLFEYAAGKGRAFVTTDRGIQKIADGWLREGRVFRMIVWKQELLYRMSDGDFLTAFEDLAQTKAPFLYAIQHIKPKP